MAGSSWSGLVLAAGKGSRFEKEAGDSFPKVLRPVLGRPMVRYVLDALNDAGISDITLIVGYRAEDVTNALGDSVKYVTQPEQKGSGNAVACAEDAFQSASGSVVIMCGDSPLFSSSTVSQMMQEHEQSQAVVTLASAILDDPFGYGRILRDGYGRIKGVVEEKCAGAEERAIKEVNGGAYAFDTRWLFDNIHLMQQNEAGEYNLTDMVRVAVQQGRLVTAVKCAPSELLGVNTPDQLKNIEKLLQGRA